MRDWNAIRERYLRDALPARLGGLATNLARIRSFSVNAANREAVGYLLDESKRFIEWTAAEADIDTAAKLVELQVQLARWQLQWERIWADQVQRMQMAEMAHAWAEQVLERSGLLD